jgi:hypothetical protein
MHGVRTSLPIPLASTLPSSSSFFILDLERTKLTTSDIVDVGKTPPSRFQQRKGSIRTTPASRSEHTDKCVKRDGAFHDKHAEIKDKPLFSLSSEDRRGSRATAESGTIELCGASPWF